MARVHKDQLKISESAVSEGRPMKKAKLRAIAAAQSFRLDKGWIIAGFDTQMSSIAGAAIGYDRTLKKFKGPVFTMRRWSKEDHYFDRLEMAAKGQELVSDLQTTLGIYCENSHIYIAQEEPFPLVGKFVQTGNSGFLKQQAEISGAFLGGLLRYGYKEIWQMPSLTWRQAIAAELGITIHHSKWRSPELAARFNCKPADSGKFRSKQWALSLNAKAELAVGVFNNEIPDWPDIIESSKLGKIPRPEGSVAKAVQPDDRYDALAIMWALYRDLDGSGNLS